MVCPVVVEFYRLHKLGVAGPGPLLRVPLTYRVETGLMIWSQITSQNVQVAALLSLLCE